MTSSSAASTSGLIEMEVRLYLQIPHATRHQCGSSTGASESGIHLSPPSAHTHTHTLSTYIHTHTHTHTHTHKPITQFPCTFPPERGKAHTILTRSLHTDEGTNTHTHTHTHTPHTHTHTLPFPQFLLQIGKWQCVCVCMWCV